MNPTFLELERLLAVLCQDSRQFRSCQSERGDWGKIWRLHTRVALHLYPFQFRASVSRIWSRRNRCSDQLTAFGIAAFAKYVEKVVVKSAPIAFDRVPLASVLPRCICTCDIV